MAAYKALGLSQEKAGRTAAADATKDLPEIPADRFGEYLSMIKPKPGEYDWHDEIPWILSIDEARRKAAEEDKPILIWKSADGNPLGAT